jgi:hypothetical protein
MQVDEGESKKKRGRKLQRIASEADVPDKRDVDAAGPPTKAARTSEPLIDPMLETLSAPVAQIW